MSELLNDNDWVGQVFTGKVREFYQAPNEDECSLGVKIDLGEGKGLKVSFAYAAKTKRAIEEACHSGADISVRIFGEPSPDDYISAELV